MDNLWYHVLVGLRSVRCRQNETGVEALPKNLLQLDGNKQPYPVINKKELLELLVQFNKDVVMKSFRQTKFRNFEFKAPHQQVFYIDVIPFALWQCCDLPIKFKQWDVTIKDVAANVMRGTIHLFEIDLDHIRHQVPLRNVVQNEELLRLEDKWKAMNKPDLVSELKEVHLQLVNAKKQLQTVRKRKYNVLDERDIKNGKTVQQTMQEWKNDHFGKKGRCERFLTVRGGFLAAVKTMISQVSATRLGLAMSMSIHQSIANPWEMRLGASVTLGVTRH